MRVHSHSVPQSESSKRFTAAPLYAALLAAAVLSACSGGSAWRSSSAMTSDRAGVKTAKAEAPASRAAAAPQKPAGPAPAARNQPLPSAGGAGGTPGSSTTRPQTASDNAATSMQSGETENAARPAQGGESGTANSLATSESGAASPSGRRGHGRFCAGGCDGS